jgi:hypothetical protein
MYFNLIDVGKNQYLYLLSSSLNLPGLPHVSAAARADNTGTGLIPFKGREHVPSQAPVVKRIRAPGKGVCGSPAEPERRACSVYCRAPPSRFHSLLSLNVLRQTATAEASLADSFTTQKGLNPSRR